MWCCGNIPRQAVLFKKHLNPERPISSLRLRCKMFEVMGAFPLFLLCSAALVAIWMVPVVFGAHHGCASG